MKFRSDINGLRAIAVIAVVLFHFNESWLPGGFAGVDVFFVISGFLMTGIIFTGIEESNFSIINFYISRANRIIPALAMLCVALLVFGWFYLTPLDYKVLSKHVGSSMSFVSNIVYWREAGYFEAASHEKWLLHTWSLSAEWQFYIIYPLLLVGMHKFFSLQALKATILLGTILGFIFCIVATYIWPDPAYYLLPTRAWEMLLGGVAFLYPFKLKDNRKKFLEWGGVILIAVSYIAISKENLWPGYLALIPVLGAFLIIQAQQKNSFITGNFIFQKIGKWSYSIYLWHWPLVVVIYYFSLNDLFIYLGIILSVILGFLSNKYIESQKFRSDFVNILDYLKCEPIYFTFITCFFAFVVFTKNGFIQQSPAEYQNLISSTKQSPYRNKCHIEKYQDPASSCEYEGKKIYWATFGDSHSTEIAYALAQKLKVDDIGIKHFSFSNCKPSYLEDEKFSKCSKWYNEVVSYIIKNNDIRNVVFNHRFTAALIGGSATDYPQKHEYVITDEVIKMTENIDALINMFAANKDNVYVFFPIPELQRDIHQLVGKTLRNNEPYDYIVGTSTAWYDDRNKYIINHFNNHEYPENVHFLNSKEVFCDRQSCYAVKNGVPLYFDDDHPSISGAFQLVELIR